MNSFKLNKIHVFIVALFSVLASCSNDVLIEDGVNEPVGNGQMQTVRMRLDVGRTEFDSSENDATRAVRTDWKEGDVLYLRFHTDEGFVVGNATYNAEQGDWTVNYYGALNKNADAQVEISYFTGVKYTTESVIALSPSNGIFQDTEATYRYSSTDKTLTMHGNLKPMTGRIRLKGSVGVEVSIGVLTYSEYNIYDRQFTTNRNFVSAEVKDDGYTEYIYGKQLPQESQLQISTRDYAIDAGYLFTTMCDDKVLQVGKSGWMDIPTESSRNGWTMKQVMGKENGHRWVDLGLPSGTKWALDNMGVDYESNDPVLAFCGQVSSYGETSHKGYYSGTANIQGDYLYDTVMDKMGGKWVMPTKEDFEELMEYCVVHESVVYDYDLSGNDYYTSLVDGYAGMYIWLGFSSTYREFWTATPYSSSKVYAFRVNDNGSGCEVVTVDRTTSSNGIKKMAIGVIKDGTGSNTNTEDKMTYTVNGVSFDMIKVDGGTFTMGATSEQGDDAWGDEKPAHEVTLSSYYIGETEVTQALWETVMGTNPSYYDGAYLPVERVSWDDCQEFVRIFNTLTGKSFRLPTEAEWEYAARGGKKSKGYKYSGSNYIGDVAIAVYDGISSNRTHNVKTKFPNELGLYDMAGNVGEWCQDWYGYYSSLSQTNPTGPSDGSRRVYRGGCMLDSARYCRVSYRNSDSPSVRNNCLGLRLVLSE